MENFVSKLKEKTWLGAAIKNAAPVIVPPDIVVRNLGTDITRITDNRLYWVMYEHQPFGRGGAQPDMFCIVLQIFSNLRKDEYGANLGFDLIHVFYKKSNPWQNAINIRVPALPDFDAEGNLLPLPTGKPLDPYWEKKHLSNPEQLEDAIIELLNLEKVKSIINYLMFTQ